MRNKTAVEIHKAEETLEILDCGRRRKMEDGVNMGEGALGRRGRQHDRAQQLGTRPLLW